MGGATDCLYCSKGWDAHLNARPGSTVSKKLKAVANGKRHSTPISQEVFWLLNEAGKGRVALFVLDSS